MMNAYASFQAKVVMSFCLAALAMTAVLGVSWKLAEDSAAASRSVSHTHEVLQSLEQVRADTLQIEFSTQSYRISGDPTQLAERDAKTASRELTLEHIRQLTTDNAAQQQRWHDLRAVLNERVAISQRVEALRRNEGVNAANAFVAGAPLRETRLQTFELIAGMDRAERSLLEWRSAEQRQARRHAVMSGVAVTASLFALLAASYAFIRRQLRQTEAGQRALAEAQRQAEQAQREQNRWLEQRVQERTAQLRDSEEHLRSVIGNVPAMIAYIDACQRYVYVNTPYLTRFAQGASSITGRTVREVLGPQRYAKAAPLIDAVLRGQAQSYDWEPFPNVWQSIEYVPRRDRLGVTTGYYVLGTDITERKQAEERIRTLNSTLNQRLSDLQRVDRALRTLSAGNRSMLRAVDEQQLLQSMCDAIVEAGSYPIAMVWYANQDERQSLQVMAQSGYPPGLPVLQQLRPSWGDNPHGQGAVANAVRTGRTTVVGNMQIDPSYEPWRPYLLGNSSCVACPLRLDGRIVGALAIFAPELNSFGPDEVQVLTESADDLGFGIATLRAVAEKRRAQAAIHKLTHFDVLTGLPNEAQFTESLVAAKLDARQRGQSLVVLQTNVERLGEINDALGFVHGDGVLKEFAQRLRAALPDAAVLARLRGDEFAVLLPDSDAAAGIEWAGRLERALAAPFPVGGILLDVTAKTGIAVFPEHGSERQELLRHLAIAMHHAKKTGAAHAVFEPALDLKKPQRLSMAGELRRAIEGGDLLVYLQPKLEIATGNVCGSEALVRWKHAERGMIQPGEFIALAEHTGLIKPLTEWMIEAVSHLNIGWKGTGCALPIAVNLSARNLHDENLIRKIRPWARASGLLELELTESAVMENAEFALKVLHGLREEGIPLYIDDFGTGYSSLSYLQKLPVDCIKIDQSFVRDMGSNPNSAMIVRSTIDLMHDLGRKVVAEGIETRETWDQLRRLGCDIAQGYFIARPMPAVEFPAWVERHRSRNVFAAESRLAA